MAAVLASLLAAEERRQQERLERVRTAEKQRRRILSFALAASVLTVIGVAVIPSMNFSPAPPPTPAAPLTEGIKQWAGYAPLVVAKDLDLCAGLKLQLEKQQVLYRGSVPGTDQSHPDAMGRH